MLLSMGKEQIYVWEMRPGILHENDAAERLCALCLGEGMERSEVREGKIELTAARDGLFRVRSERLRAVNAIDEIMIATRHGNTAVKKGDKPLAAPGSSPSPSRRRSCARRRRRRGRSPCWRFCPTS